MKRNIFILLLIIILLILSGCATQEYAATYRKQKSLMILDNTDLSRNMKYYKQKHNRYNESDYRKHVKRYRITK